MKTYIVDYDLNSPGQAYRDLYTALEQLGARRMMLSTWVMQSHVGAVAIRELLWANLDQNDRLFVCEVSGDWAGYNMLATPDVFKGTQVNV